MSKQYSPFPHQLYTAIGCHDTDYRPLKNSNLKLWTLHQYKKPYHVEMCVWRPTSTKWVRKFGRRSSNLLEQTAQESLGILVRHSAVELCEDNLKIKTAV